MSASFKSSLSQGDRVIKTIVCVCMLLPMLYIRDITAAQDLSFVVISDCRTDVDPYRLVLQEIDTITAGLRPGLSSPQFLVFCGDFDPVAGSMAIYEDALTYPHLPPFYPVVGNHEFETAADMDYILNDMIPRLERVVNRGPQATYSFDYGPVHCVVLDEYAFNDEGEVDADLQAWLQMDLNVTDKDHVFVFGHEPAFPRILHVGDSLDQFKVARDSFWSMLVLDPRVRAFFCGHTHYYSRMRVVDPSSVGLSGYPDQEGGVYQIICGVAGQTGGDEHLTIVHCQVHEDSVYFQAVSSPREEARWEVADVWSIPRTQRSDMEIVQPIPGSQVSGPSQVIWSVSGEAGPVQGTIIYVSRDAGAHWDTLAVVPPQETTHMWNTADYPDGTRYLLRIVAKTEDGFGMAQSQGRFTINNPGNGMPEVSLLSPSPGDTLHDEVEIRWEAADADGDLLVLTLEASIDDGATWFRMASDESNDGQYFWDTRTVPNSKHYRLRLTGSDGTVMTETVSRAFAVQNDREVASDAVIIRLSGFGSGSIAAHIIDPGVVTDHLYRVSFDDTSDAVTTYSVYDVESGTAVVDDAVHMDGWTEGPLFDGLRLVIDNYAVACVDLDHTGWTSSDLEYTISVPEIDLGTEIVRGTPYPADYEIRICEGIVDTSSSFLGAPQGPISFVVWNVTEGRQVDVIYIDFDGDGAISRLDEVYVLEEDPDGSPMLTWLIFFAGREDYIPPSAGDVFAFRTLKPFTHQDLLEFTLARGERGDVNGDGSRNVLDVVSIVRHIVNLTPLRGNALWRADCNGDGDIDVQDVIGLVRAMIGAGDCGPQDMDSF